MQTSIQLANKLFRRSLHQLIPKSYHTWQGRTSAAVPAGDIDCRHSRQGNEGRMLLSISLHLEDLSLTCTFLRPEIVALLRHRKPNKKPDAAVNTHTVIEYEMELKTNLVSTIECGFFRPPS